MGEGIDPGGAAVQKMGQNDEEDEGGEHALCTIPIIDSINYVYGKIGHYSRQQNHSDVWEFWIVH